MIVILVSLCMALVILYFKWRKYITRMGYPSTMADPSSKEWDVSLMGNVWIPLNSERFEWATRRDKEPLAPAYVIPSCIIRITSLRSFQFVTF